MIEVDLGLGHDAPGCRALADRLYVVLHPKYGAGASAMPLPRRYDEYLAAHRTARKRAQRCRALGYSFGPVTRSMYEDDIFEINNSKAERQGRLMDPAYRTKQSYRNDPEVVCPWHANYFYGVVDADGRLRAYTWTYRCGDLLMLSTILGHGDHLKNDVMYELVTGVIASHANGTLFYNLHRSGTDGLRYFKERLGLSPTDIAWRL